MRPFRASACLRKRSVVISYDMEPAGIQVSQTKVGAIINTSSGSCDSESEKEMLGILKGTGVTNCKTWCGESDQIERAFAEVATHKPEVLVSARGRRNHPHGCRSVRWNRHLSSPAARRHAECASSGTIRRFILARSA